MNEGDSDDEWYAPEPFGWRGVVISTGAIVITAITLHYIGWGQVKPPSRFKILQWQPMQDSIQWCHIARFYFDGKIWRCL
jgi:hypothetical protein